VTEVKGSETKSGIKFCMRVAHLENKLRYLRFKFEIRVFSTEIYLLIVCFSVVDLCQLLRGQVGHHGAGLLHLRQTVRPLHHHRHRNLHALPR